MYSLDNSQSILYYSVNQTILEKIDMRFYTYIERHSTGLFNKKFQIIKSSELNS